MKQELLKKINPITEEFIDKILGSFNDLPQIRKQLVNDQRKYQDLCDDKERKVKEIKDLKTSERKEHNQKITNLENAKDDYILKVKNYEDLTNSIKAKEKKIDDNAAKSEIELIRAKEIRGKAEDELDKANHTKSDYELKLGSLKIDSERVDKDNLFIESEKKKLSVRENNAYKNEAKNGEKAQELNDLSLKVKADRAEVDRLIKLYKLKM